jgi:Cytochrome c oxidase caa3 assembly factor (Caa3_CtaG)
MTSVEVTKPSRAWLPGFRGFLSIVALVVTVLALAPPMWGWSLRYGFVQALQFSVFAFGLPAIIAASAPWRGMSHPVDPASLENLPSWFRRWNARRVREKAQFRTLSAATGVILVTIFWRLTPSVDALVHHSWLIPIEAITLLVPGVLLMLELMESPPLTPGISRPYRIGVTAVVMWSAWIVCYLSAMAQKSWYNVFHYTAGQGLSATADQQLSAGLVMLVSACVFLPIVFWNLVHWLGSEEDPDEEIIKLFRQEREHGFFGNAD